MDIYPATNGHGVFVNLPQLKVATRPQVLCIKCVQPYILGKYTNKENMMSTIPTICQPLGKNSDYKGVSCYSWYC